MNKKQTAVEWMVSQLPPIQQEGLRDIIEQAKAMEREQIMMAVKESWYMAKGSNFQEPQEDQYFTETYGTK